MAMVEDFSAFMQLSDFAVNATLAGLPVRAIFDRDYAQAEVGFSGMATTSPALTLKTSDVPAASVGLAVVVAGSDYRIAEHKPDGTGISVLMLELA